MKAIMSGKPKDTPWGSQAGAGTGDVKVTRLQEVDVWAFGGVGQCPS
jgi:hypothetical protein